ncbi:glycosyltransferase family 2 protein [Flavobacterium franklandianum]|uniref:Glycosyltransferase family 2 protein n=1 Tax=Flavobacterium franklandianum TaxID=2594430 RepID=A0A553CKF1_9FLAO|nr:glycosyltransferase [Flavobacterium franklandianum]TRX20935.1 glycosyltransferase family 2 protein [Flavobacterium franklandianum]
MKFSLIICTYMRPESVLQLLQSVQEQTLYPDEILIIDGSTNSQTATILKENKFENLHYFAVPPEHRGLTKQRNYGVKKAGSAMKVIAFLDDDTVLSTNYFEEIIKTFEDNQDVSGVGGVAINENSWTLAEPNKNYNKNQYYLWEGFVYKEGQRNVVRNYLGLQSNLGLGRMPDYSHGKTCGFPLNGKTYEVDLLIGMSFAFRRKVVDSIRFSPYFEGYGLYEDADFSIRALQFGKNVINTKAQLSHFHHPSGRPNQYRYGKMVVRNGWYVWRVKNPKPSLNAKIKWHSITILLTLIRFTNTFTTTKKKVAFTEAIGRTIGWWSLLLNKPNLNLK